MKTALSTEDPSFEEWKNTPNPKGVRHGQWLMNTAPTFICTRATEDVVLDCFNRDDRVPAFVAFAELVWDLPSQGHNESIYKREMEAARAIVYDLFG